MFMCVCGERTAAAAGGQRPCAAANFISHTVNGLEAVQRLGEHRASRTYVRDELLTTDPRDFSNLRHAVDFSKNVATDGDGGVS